MKRILAALTLLLAPATASAGIGFTAHQAATYSARGYYYSPMNLPSLDIVNEGLVIQLHALDLLEALNYENIDIGVAVYKTTNSGAVNDNWKGVVQPGGTIEINTNFDFDPLNIALVGEARLGFQKAQDFGFGLYVVPGIGGALVGDEVEMMVSGGIQVAAWM